MSKPVAVLISDIHFTINTLDKATKALSETLRKSRTLHIPTIICGDTLDGKAVMRAECVNALINVLKAHRSDEMGFSENAGLPVYILVGNHDLLNEKSSDHALRFIGNGLATIIDTPSKSFQMLFSGLPLQMFPYVGDSERLAKALSEVPKGSTIIMHQGVQSAYMGHYLQDTSSLPKEAFKDFRVISGHYHKRQDIECGEIKKGNVGVFSYVGNPYTLTYGESEDGPKGYQILHSDGSLEFMPLSLPRHVTHKAHYNNIPSKIEGLNSDDHLLLRVSGPASELEKLDKKEIGERLLGHNNYRLDPVADDPVFLVDEDHPTPSLSAEEILDNIIESSSETPEFKKNLKTMWRKLIND